MSQLIISKTAMTRGALRAGIAALALVVTGIVTASPASAVEEPSYFRVNLQSGGKLNVRKTPSLKGAKVGALPAKAEKVVNHGCHVGMPYLEWREATTAVRKVETRRKWCNIEYKGVTGWTAGQYLEAEAPE
ncbi:MAG: hypothetical protein EP348_05005 [Alphaproteobacteria bacterium]|nr:MAG: hypothetical protein EP348_05005 [Alphaproteobacteria bacterium]